MLMVGEATGMTLTDVELLTLLPAESVSVPVIVYVPALVKTCVTVVLALMAPRSSELPSPQSRWMFRIVSPVGTVPTPTVNVAGRPALGRALGGVIVSVRFVAL